MNDFTRCPGCRLIRPEGEGLCPSCAGSVAEYERDRIEAEADIARLKVEPEDARDEGWEAEEAHYLRAEANDPDPEPFRPAEAYAPDPRRGEGPAQAVLPMPEAGPLFAGRLEAKS